MHLSVIDFIKPAASGDKLGLRGATNQIFCLQQQTRCVLVEVLRCNSRETSNSIYLCPCISPLATFPRTENPSPAKTLLLVASSDAHGLFFTSGFHLARWLLSKPPKLEATKRHPVGHL
jgi:hypothetical protein